MKKEDLAVMGLTEEQAEKVWSGLDGNYVTKARFNEVNEESKTLKQAVKERDDQLETLKVSAGDNESLRKQIADLQKQNADQKNAHDAELNQVRVDNAIEQALSGAKAKNLKAVKALLDLSDARLDKDGTVKGLSKQIEQLVNGEDTGFLFEAAVGTATFKGFQPGASADPKPGMAADPNQMSYSQMVAYLEANPAAKLN